MKTPLFFLALLTLLTGALFAQEVEKLSEPQTLLFIRTVPEGARVLIDGKGVGATDDLFPIEPGVRRIVIELDGHTPQAKELTIRAGQITRLVLELKQSQSPTDATMGSDTNAVATVLKATINDVDDGQGREAIDLDRARQFNLPDMNGWSHKQRQEWVVDNKIDFLAENVRNRWGLVTTDLTLKPLANSKWDAITAAELDKVLSTKAPTPDGDREILERDGFRFYLLTRIIRESGGQYVKPLRDLLRL
jgi:hypothetical protein